jgi:ribonucleoside-diphosphate reductase alpha chain
MNTPFTYDEVCAASLEYFEGDQLAAEVFAGKYALRDTDGGILELTPEKMHRRLAREFARVEAKYPSPMSEEEIYGLLSDWSVVAQGSPMSGVGNPYQMQSLSNCFVVESPHDSYGGILKVDQEQAQIMKRRGGVGFDISTIRPKGLSTSNAARTTDGIGIFMERFSNTCREVAQNGRRGALMMTLSVHHPEVRTFINIKRDLKQVTGANISLRLSDEFMKAVKAGDKVQLRFPVDRDEPALIEEWVDARSLWHELVDAAWTSAEPGLLFWDTVTRRSPADAYARFGYGSTSTNPCGEITLSPYDSCRLLLNNLYRFVIDPFTPEARFDFERYDRVAQCAQRLMDDLVDLELEAVERIIDKIKADPEPTDVKRPELELWKKIRNAATNGRRTGLGITALGDALAALGIKYGSDDAVEMTEQIYRAHALASYRSSVQMAKERGSFPVYDHVLEADHEFIRQIMDQDAQLDEDYRKYGRRNIANTTTAPAGSVSILTQTTSGCENAFLLMYDRWKKMLEDDASEPDRIDDSGDRWKKYRVYHHGFKTWMDVTGKTEDDIEESPYWGATSADIDWVKKIDMQAAAQRWICHSISNTTNIPKDMPLETAKEIYMRGWESGCKGVTIYREGSRDGVMTAVGETKQDTPQGISENHAPKRPKQLPCDIHRASVKGEKYVVLVGKLEDHPYEIFCGLSDHIEIPRKSDKGMLLKNGKVNGVATYNLSIPIGDDDELLLKNVVEIFDNPVYGAFTRSLSLALRHGVPVQYIVEQLRKDKNSDMTSFNRVVARILSKAYIEDGTSAVSFEKMCPGDRADGTPCGSTNLAYQGGCVTCMECGNSKCG